MANLTEYNRRIVRDNIELTKKLVEAEAKVASDEQVEKSEAYDYLMGRGDQNE